MAPPVIKTYDTSLKNHVAAFEDPAMPGFVTTAESTKTLEAMGVSHGWAKFIATVIVAGLGPKTQGGSKTKLSIDDVNSAKRTDSTQVFQPNGTFSPTRLQEIMTAFDKDKDDVLTLSEIHAMQFNIAKTPNGKLTTKLEFGLLLAMFADRQVTVNGVKEPGLSRGTLTKFYDGSLFKETLMANRKVGLNTTLFKKELRLAVAAVATRTQGVANSAQKVTDQFEAKVGSVFGAFMP